MNLMQLVVLGYTIKVIFRGQSSYFLLIHLFCFINKIFCYYLNNVVNPYIAFCFTEENLCKI